MIKDRSYDIAVVGAGVFGSWTAYELQRAGADVILLDAYGPGNSRSSSGGESRIIRMGYGPDAIYTGMAKQSLQLWLELFDRSARQHLFQPTGVLWLARGDDAYSNATLKNFEQHKITFEKVEGSELKSRYPQLQLSSDVWGILEIDSGAVMARQAVQLVVTQAHSAGATYLQEAIQPSRSVGDDSIESIETTSGRRIVANRFVFACGPWLPKLFPELLSELIYVTRQEVFFLGVPAGDDSFLPGRLPAWIDFNDLVYGIPNLDNRGYKIAVDKHGPEFDPDTGDRLVSENSLESLREYLARRMPSLANAPLLETRVCQYENTSNGDFLIDRHPVLENVWLVGGGSGHGFKHGPAVGKQVASLISGAAEVEPRFSLASKEKRQQRQVY